MFLLIDEKLSWAQKLSVSVKNKRKFSKTKYIETSKLYLSVLIYINFIYICGLLGMPGQNDFFQYDILLCDYSTKSMCYSVICKSNSTQSSSDCI